MKIHKEGEYSFIDEGSGEPLVLLHGLFGALSNWEWVVNKFSKNYRVIIPLLPIYEMPIKKAWPKPTSTPIRSFMKSSSRP